MRERRVESRKENYGNWTNICFKKENKLGQKN